MMNDRHPNAETKSRKTKDMTTLCLRKSIGRTPSRRGGLTSAATALLLLAAVCKLNAQSSQNFIPGTIKEFKTAGSTSFVVPTGITKILAQLWGAGGGGGSTTSSNPKGGDGGVGAYSCKVLTVTAGSTLSITLGTGGSGNCCNSGSAGGNSSIKILGSSTLLTAGGGGGGSFNGTNGAPGTPDPNAQIGRGANVLPDPFKFGQGGVEPFYRDFPPIGGFGGLGAKSPAVSGKGGNGYAVLQF
jgi:hypothetical protein